MALFAEELKDKQSLLARQLARKTEVLALQRAEAALAGELGELTAAWPTPRSASRAPSSR